MAEVHRSLHQGGRRLMVRLLVPFHLFLLGGGRAGCGSSRGDSTGGDSPRPRHWGGSTRRRLRVIIRGVRNREAFSAGSIGLGGLQLEQLTQNTAHSTRAGTIPRVGPGERPFGGTLPGSSVCRPGLTPSGLGLSDIADETVGFRTRGGG